MGQLGHPLREIQAQHFARELRGRTENGSKFVFLLGAGASRSSGIPTGAELVEEWLRRFWREAIGDADGATAEDFSSVVGWARGGLLPNLDGGNLGASYGPAIEAFFPSEALRANEIHRLCATAEPGFAYAFLAKLIEAGIPAGSTGPGAFPAVLTTNFDDLVSVAMTWWSARRPRVVTDAALGHHIDLQGPDPLVVHLHGAYQLKPLNTSSETSGFRSEMVARLRTILADKGLIFVGYGGHDDSVCKLLTELPRKHCSHGIYWVSADAPEPEPELSEWLDSEGATYVRCPDFDELAYALHQSYRINAPNARRFETVVDEVNRLLQTFADSRKSSAAKDHDSLPTRRDGSTENGRAWASVFDALLAASAAETVDERAAIYAEAMKSPEYENDSRLLASYAIFLSSEIGDASSADALYKRAIDADPENFHALLNYAIFLFRHGMDMAVAEGLLHRALKLDPTDADALSLLGSIEAEVHGDTAAAEAHFKEALDSEPHNAQVIVNYADFKMRIGEVDRAEGLFERALEVSPGNPRVMSGYAICLSMERRDFDRADELYERAFAAGESSAQFLSNYATHLWRRGAEADRIREQFLAAIEADPGNRIARTNYANFLFLVCGERAKAREEILEVLSHDPNLAMALGTLSLIQFADGEVESGVESAERALSLATRPMYDQLLAEVHLYLFACGEPEKQSEHRSALELLVDRDGVRSPEWDFSAVIERAKTLGRPGIAEAQEWARKITSVTE